MYPKVERLSITCLQQVLILTNPVNKIVDPFPSGDLQVNGEKQAKSK